MNASVNTPNSWGSLPLISAVNVNTDPNVRTNIVRSLLKADADVNAKEVNNKDAFYWAKCKNWDDEFNTLVAEFSSR